jgi:hypothetical protein
MKLRTTTLALFGATLLACTSPEERARKSEEVKRDADRKAAEISNDTQRKLDEAQRKADEEKDRITRDGQKKMDDVRQAADKTTRDNDETITKSRIDLRDSSNRKLDDLDKRFVDIDGKLRSKLSNADYDRVMNDLRAKKDAAKKSIADLENTTDFDGAKRTIDQRLDDYDKAIDDAKKRL